MRQSHEEELTPEQMQELATGQAKVVEKQKEAKRLLEDHQLRVRCVEQAIRSIDAWPDINIPISAPLATNITNNFCRPDVRLIAEQIYAFVNEPLMGISNNIKNYHEK